MRYSNKEFQNIISRIWLNASSQEVRQYIEAVKEDLIHREYTRKEQKSVLSRCWMKEINPQRDFIDQAQTTLLDMEEN